MVVRTLRHAISVASSSGSVYHGPHAHPLETFHDGLNLDGGQPVQDEQLADPRNRDARRLRDSRKTGDLVGSELVSPSSNHGNGAQHFFGRGWSRSALGVNQWGMLEWGEHRWLGFGAPHGKIEPEN